MIWINSLTVRKLCRSKCFFPRCTDRSLTWPFDRTFVWSLNRLSPRCFAVRTLGFAMAREPEAESLNRLIPSVLARTIVWLLDRVTVWSLNRWNVWSPDHIVESSFPRALGRSVAGSINFSIERSISRSLDLSTVRSRDRLIAGWFISCTSGLARLESRWRIGCCFFHSQLVIVWYLFLTRDPGTDTWWMGDKRTHELVSILRPPRGERWKLVDWPEEHCPTYCSVNSPSEQHWDIVFIYKWNCCDASLFCAFTRVYIQGVNASPLTCVGR